jgi:hypothetical protein
MEGRCINLELRSFIRESKKKDSEGRVEMKAQDLISQCTFMLSDFISEGGLL